jgi:tetratricopeptide (TPR) repeat protein
MCVAANSLFAQSQFPLTRMWDAALDAAQRSGRPVLVFNVDMVDTLSIAFRDTTIRRRDVQQYLSENFELAVNDFAVDPPPSVGLDSLRNLGLKLSGLEERYRIIVRPTVIVLHPNGSEVDRITFANRLSAEQFMQRVEEIRQGRNLIGDFIDAFWADTTSELGRIDLINRFEQRSDYDSVVYHLDVLRQTSMMPHIKRESMIRHAYLRFQVEGNTVPLRRMMSGLNKANADDSIIYLTGLQDLLHFYQTRKQVDTASAIFEEIIKHTGVRDADVLNEYAWELANFGRRLDYALQLVNEAIEKRPDDENFFDTRGMIYLLQKKYELAYADAAKAHDLADIEERTYFKERMDFYKVKLDEWTAEQEKSKATQKKRK